MIADPRLAHEPAKSVAAGVTVHGSILMGILRASHSLNLLLHGPEASTALYQSDEWYPVDEVERLLSLVNQYRHPERILSRIGMEMMRQWYKHGPGREHVKDGLDFLHFQTGSRGFHSVFRGADDKIGRFELLRFDESGGLAVVHSTTIFPKALELGVLRGGLGLSEAVAFNRVVHDAYSNNFIVYFVTPQNRTTLKWHSGDPCSLSAWRVRYLQESHRQEEAFWLAIHETLNAAYIEMQRLATVDALTGVCNRREFMRLAAIEFHRSQRTRSPMSVLYLDVDGFKQINDRFGHHAGDRVITSLGQMCQRSCRVIDIVGRLGGDEFAILCPNTGEADSHNVANRILQAARDMLIPIGKSIARATVSLGMATLNTHHHDVDALIAAADRNLLKAKRRGRDQCVF